MITHYVCLHCNKYPFKTFPPVPPVYILIWREYLRVVYWIVQPCFGADYHIWVVTVYDVQCLGFLFFVLWKFKLSIVNLFHDWVTFCLPRWCAAFGDEQASGAEGNAAKWILSCVCPDCQRNSKWTEASHMLHSSMIYCSNSCRYAMACACIRHDTINYSHHN